MKRLIYTFICASLLGISCSDDDCSFDKNAQERIDELFVDCDKTLLNSEYGWKMEYYPDSRRLGGYNFFFKFEESGKVTMSADFRDDVQTTTYKYYGGQGAVLSFDTYNLLHILADPGYIPAGTGCRGDYELVIQRITPDTVYCVGRKWKQPMVLVKAQKEDQGALDKIKANEKMLVPVGEDTPFFRNIKVGGKDVATFLYDFSNRFVEYYYNDSKGSIQSGRMPVIFSRDGFNLKEPIVVNGTTLENFVYDESINGFTFGEGGSLTIEHTSSVKFKEAWDSFYEFPGGSLYQTSRDFLTVFNAAKVNAPDLASIQLYWNISGLRLLSFVFSNVGAENPRTRWFHTVMTGIEKSDDGCVKFEPNFNPAVGKIVFFPNSVEHEKECNELFMEDNEASAGLKKLVDIFFNPEGFTVIQTADGNYYLISKEKSNYWMLFRPMN